MDKERPTRDKSSSSKPSPSAATKEVQDVTQHDPEEQAWSTSNYNNLKTQTTTSSKAESQSEDQDDPVANDDAADQEDEDEESPLPPPKPSSFAPFYTLVVDPTTATHAHPTVHYIFADDDPELLTEALLRSADASTQAAPFSTAEQEEEERIVLIDLSSDGQSVVSATSLSPNWQALQTSLSPAPSWQGTDAAGADGTGKVSMLRIWGEEAGKGGVKGAAGVGLGIGEGVGARGRADVDGLMRKFESGLKGLDDVLGPGGVGEDDEGDDEGGVDVRKVKQHEDEDHEAEEHDGREEGQRSGA
jgi:hypothetical protein